MKKKNGQNDVAVKLLKKYRARIAREGWIKAALCGLSVGFGLDIICALAFWFFNVKYFWICIAVFAVSAAIATPIFYALKFKTTTAKVASRVDMLGLEERILTMAQFADDDSFMARYQREDAMRSLESINASLLKIAVPTSMIVVCASLCLVGVGTTAASAVSNRSLQDIITPIEDEVPSYYTLKYGVMDGAGGRVDGVVEQIIENGSEAEMVQAVADENYVFVGWSDGYADATRQDTETEGDLEVYAIFVDIENDDESGDEDPTKQGDGDSNSGEDMPPQDGGPDKNGPDNSDDGDGDDAAGTSSPSNQVIDGDTYYGNEYSGSLESAQGDMNGSDYSGNQEGVIGDYFNNIAK